MPPGWKTKNRGKLTFKVAPVDKFSLVLVAIFAYTFLGEHPSAREWFGIVMVAGGVLVLAIKP